MVTARKREAAFAVNLLATIVRCGGRAAGKLRYPIIRVVVINAVRRL